MTRDLSELTRGWSVCEWIEFHLKSVPSTSYEILSNLLKSQRCAPEDPAWISLVSETNLQQQWQVLQSKSKKETLPLYGVPVAIKDNIDVYGVETTAACPSFAYKPKKDAKVVELLRDAGAIVLGKTNLDQFATGLVGCRSPYGKTTCAFSDEHVSGGSSAGSGTIVARGIVPLALGTDTAGSGRVPAALNNVIGLKPTKGVFSCQGVVPACKSLDCVSIFALNLSDAERTFKILCQPDLANDEYSRAFVSNPLQHYPKDVCIAIPDILPWFGETANPKIFSSAVTSLRLSGAKVVTINFEPLLELAHCLYEGAWVAERYEAIREFLATDPPSESLDPTVINIIRSGSTFSAADAFKFEYKRQRILKKVESLLQGIDVLCVPTCPLNPKLEDLQREPVLINSRQGTWTNFVNLADMAALAVPAGMRTEDGLPTGITLIGKKFTDYALLDLAKRYFQTRYPGGTRNYGVFTGRHVGTKDEELTGPEIEPSKSIKLAVVGAHLKGLPLHWQMQKCNATYLSSPKTSNNYKLYALPKTGPILKPGLRRVDETVGSQIQLELYSIPLENFGTMMSMVPEPLGIGSVELETGEWVKSFICEEAGYTAKGSVDITSFGGFRSYIDCLQREKGKVQRPFKTVLVANRGEIAVRIIKTLKKLKITSVAVFSDPDRYAQHVLDADIAVPLHGVSAAQTYLDIEKIIAAATKTNTEAIIPGYGFLSENADFSDRCTAEGIVFVGPAGDAIRRLGLKHSARDIAAKAGVPLVPGSPLVTSASDAKKIAAELEYPIMVKSTAGGGGIGLQKVDSEDQIEHVFETVQHQGKSFFGDSGVFLERFVENARHVEIQMMGDGYGKAIALGERDCSLQRRNQKVVEETPAPNLSDFTRARMRNASENLASLLKYKCAGTVEFIYDEKRDEFYFLEVNARLQVEHPITEAVTGLDLVEWMLRIAADQPMNFDSSHINISSAAIEVRVYAENPIKDFRPSPGQLTNVKFPKWARVDTWVTKGTRISAEYDPTLAKIIVHGKDRNEAILKMNRALSETAIYGCVTNLDYLRSIVSSDMFNEAKVATKVLDSFVYKPYAFEILSPGAQTSIQDYPGRLGYWRIGVPPSGPMDSYSFRLANRIVGNHSKAPAIEITLAGPKIKFHTEATIAITGGKVPCILNDFELSQNRAIDVKRGDVLFIGKLITGCRSYLAIRNGIDIPEYLGSRSTFTLGEFGGYNGRVLKLGDVLFLNQPQLEASTLPGPEYAPETPPEELIPEIHQNKEWNIGVTCGPHGSPDFFQEESAKRFFNETWKVHYNSNRFGVRLIGPKPKWARADGGEAGLHPSNAHDYVYSVGAINFTGDEPVIVACDGPSLGGFVCEAVVAEAEMWKVGQVRPGDVIRFAPISYKVARELQESQDEAIKTLSKTALKTLVSGLELSTIENAILAELPKSSDYSPKVTYRQAGDRYILVEYGENQLDLNICYRINRLIDLVERHGTVGIIEMSQGVRSVLIQFDGYKISQTELLRTLIAYENEIHFEKNWSVKSKVIRLPMAFEDSKTLACVTRYQETIRSNAPWLPNNVDFIADVNGISREEVRDMLYTARFLVLGLGDVFLSSPCAVPLDPRQRFLGTKYNPSRTFTERGAVGIGGMYMCIYAAASPGGYQLVGRTIPIWDKLAIYPDASSPWMLSPFDQIEFYPVSEKELEKLTDDCENGQFKVKIEDTVFDHKDYLEWVQDNIESIEDFQKNQIGEKSAKFSQLIQTANSELEQSQSKPEIQESYPDDSELVYSEYSGRFWKPVVKEGDLVKRDQALIIVEAMKTEMTVIAPQDGKVYKILHKNGDVIDAGDVVVVLQ